MSESSSCRDSVRRLVSRLLKEQQAHWDREDPVPVETYLDHYPELRANPEAAVDLIYQEVLLRRSRGQAVGLSDCLRRFPEYQAQLREQFELSQILRAPGLQQTLPASAAEPEAPRRPKAPAVPGYEIVRELGRGGMGLVYLAYHLGLKRYVAIKVIHARGRSQSRSRARFRTEAEAIARLHHPNVVQIHEVGEHPDGPYLVLEYLDGGSLDAKLAGTPQPPREAARLVETLARAVHHAHERGIVHRDVKPGNVLLTGEGVPKIGDFGLALLVEGDSGGTESGTVLGTASYLPPEQTDSRRGAVGPAADTYGLGAILYEMLTGRPPFQGENQVETILQVLTADPVPPRHLQPRVPRDLETICQKCLEKKPGKRYASALALAEDLARFLEGRPIKARPTRLWERGLKWARRRPAVATLAAICLGIALLAFGLVTWQWHVADTARGQEAEQRNRFQRLSTEMVLDRGLRWCSQGDVSRGMLELVRCLELAGEGQEDLRNVARSNLADWSHALCSVKNVFPQEGKILAAALSPDGRTALLACADRKAYLWDLSTGERVGDPLPHEARINAVAFGPDGKTILTGTGDPASPRGAAYLWDVTTRQLVRTLEHNGPVRGVAFSPDGRQILTGSSNPGPDEGTAQLWEVDSGKPLGAPFRHRRPVIAVAYSPDGQTIATGCEDRSCRLWDVTSRRIRYLPHGGFVEAVAFSPDATTVLTGSRDSMARLWDIRTEKPKQIGKPMRHQGYVSAVAFSRDGKTLLTGSRDSTACLWDAATHEPFGSALAHQDQVIAVAFHPQGRTLLTASFDGSAKVWQRPAGKTESMVLRHPNQVSAAAYSPDGRKVVAARSNGSIQLWDRATGKEDGPPLQLKPGPTSVAFSPDGKTVLVGCFDKTALLWDLSNRGLVREPLPHPAVVTSVAFSPDGKTLLTGCRDGRARLWDPLTGKQIGRILANPKPVCAVAFHPQRPDTVLTGGEDGKARLWDVVTGKCLREFCGHQGAVKAVAFTRDGQRIVTGSEDWTARIWDATTGQPVGSPLLHEGAVRAVAFSADGKSILTAGSDGAGRLWDVATGRMLGMPLIHLGPVRACGFSPDGRTVLTASEDMTVRLWSLPAEDPTDDVERLRLWCEICTGLELEQSGAAHALDAAGWLERRQRLRGDL
jgi:WD40 repeat protein